MLCFLGLLKRTSCYGIAVLSILKLRFGFSTFLGPALLSAEPIGLGRLSEIMRICHKKILPVSILNSLESIFEVSLFFVFLLNKCHSFLLIDCDFGFWPITSTVFNLALWNFYNSFFGGIPTPALGIVNLIGPPSPPKGGLTFVPLLKP